MLKQMMMNNLPHKNYFIPLIIFLVGLSQFGHAQEIIYKGGNGRGDGSGSTGQVFLSGGIYAATFGGGSGRGDVGVPTTMLNLNGIVWSPTYAGGSGRGDKFESGTLNFLNGDEVEVKYRGGSGNGNSLSFSTAQLLNGSPYFQLYTGGNGHGSNALLSNQIYLNGSPYIVSFSGGGGRGDKSLKSSKIYLNGTIVPLARAAVSTTFTDFVLIRNQSSSVILFWKGGQDMNVSHFVIEKGQMQTEFEQIGVIEASNHPMFQYSFPYELGSKEHNNFRIRSVLNDGSEQISEIKTVTEAGLEKEIIIFPNPASDLINIQLPDLEGMKVQIHVVNVHGIEIMSKNLGDNGSVQLDISSLDPGLYWIVTKYSGKEARKKILVN